VSYQARHARTPARPAAASTARAGRPYALTLAAAAAAVPLLSTGQASAAPATPQAAPPPAPGGIDGSGLDHHQWHERAQAHARVMELRRLARLAYQHRAAPQAVPPVSAPSAETLGDRALDWAMTQQGAPYLWGGTGPGGYDCSGLVMMAYAHEGVSLPHVTWAQIGSGHLHPVSTPVRGTLVYFYGGEHVEIYTGTGHVTLGAHSPGHGVSTVSWGDAWPPGTQFFSVT
jgi:cell wall-associated NlpC family hydrolase